MAARSSIPEKGAALGVPLERRRGLKRGDSRAKAGSAAHIAYD